MVEGTPPQGMRTCIGCRRRSDRSDLLRVVVVGGVAIPDPMARLPGRGAWVHPDGQCLSLAQRRQAFRRALRLDTSPDLKRLTELVHAQGPEH